MLETSGSHAFTPPVSAAALCPSRLLAAAYPASSHAACPPAHNPAVGIAAALALEFRCTPGFVYPPSSMRNSRLLLDVVVIRLQAPQRQLSHLSKPFLPQPRKKSSESTRFESPWRAMRLEQRDNFVRLLLPLLRLFIEFPLWKAMARSRAGKPTIPKSQ